MDRLRLQRGTMAPGPDLAGLAPDFFHPDPGPIRTSQTIGPEGLHQPAFGDAFGPDAGRRRVGLAQNRFGLAHFSMEPLADRLHPAFRQSIPKLARGIRKFRGQSDSTELFGSVLSNGAIHPQPR